MGDFIFDHILYSFAAVDITNGQKIKYIKIIDQLLLKSVQKTDVTEARLQLCDLILHNLISTCEHLKIDKGEESVIKYLVNSEALGKNLFNPNRLDYKYNLTLLDLLESLRGRLNTSTDIKKNENLIQWLKNDKNAKNSLQIIQNPNQEEYDKNVEKFKKN